MHVVERPSPSMGAQTLTFVGHYLEMCMAMCVGFVIGDIAYFWVTGLFGYSSPFSQLPELSVLVVAFAMTAPMAAWMLFRGMARRPTAEMSAAMVIWAFLVLGVGWAGFMPMSSLALVEHGLMMPAMLVPMFLRLDLYTGRTGHHMGHGQHAA